MQLMVDERFSQLQKSWTEMETSNVGTSNFAPWFLRYKLAYMKNTMIQSVRKSAGFPLTEHFTTNASESVNMILKSKMEYKKNDVPHLVNKLKELVSDQLQEIENALVNKGKYVLKENYSHLAISESKWDRMSEEARKSNIRSFHNTVAVGSLNTVLPTSVAADFPSTSSTTSISLSVPLEVAVELLHISPEIIEGVWKKAAKILATEGAIASAPGHSSSARNVLSTSKTEFHTVKPTKKYQFVCDCPHFSSLKLCSHSVATAEDNFPNF